MERCIYPPALPIYSAFLYPHTSQTTPYGTFLSLKYSNSLYYWGIRYTTEITKKVPVYLANLATCNYPAAELTSHPHLGGDDNATIFRTAETLRGEPFL